jgi:hypothetical protein
MRILTAISLAAAALCARAPCAIAESDHLARLRIVTLTAAQYAHLGAVTEPARAAVYQAQMHGYGTVLSASAIAQSDADIESATAAVLQSRAALDHAQHLFHADTAVSREALDAAVHLATADEVQLALADRKEASTYGFDAPWRGATRNAELLAKLATGATMVVQATFPLNARFDAVPASFSITRLGETLSSKSLTANTIWRAPSDPTIPGQSYYALVDRGVLGQGEHVLVYAPNGAPMAGVRVPADAVVITAQQAWCYVLTAPLTFARIAVDIDRPFQGGYFVERGIRPGDSVLVKGAGLLLSRELGPTAYSGND